MLAPYLTRVLQGESLSADDMALAMGAIMDDAASPLQIAGFLVALRQKGESVQEITGAARAMRARMTAIDIDAPCILDTCGTGGDGAGTFNISTAVAFVAAAAGVTVAKHGNRAVSSRSGSADVLQVLGVNIEASVDTMRACLNEIGIGFLFAPACHPAMRHAASIRRELGIRTIFNLLGPLTNPARATHQLLGIFDKSKLATMAATLGELGSQRAWVVHGADGLDELTLCHVTHVAEWDGKQVRRFDITPESAGLSRCDPAELKGGSPDDNAALLRDILQGKRLGPPHDAVAFNAGAALVITGKANDLLSGVQLAQQILKSGQAYGVLQKLVARTHQ